jgi:hypothetical protein
MCCGSVGPAVTGAHDSLASQGIDLVLRIAEALEEHGRRLRIAVPAGSHVRRVLQIAHVDDHVPLEASAAEAAEAIAGA